MARECYVVTVSVIMACIHMPLADINMYNIWPLRLCKKNQVASETETVTWNILSVIL